MYLTHNNIIDIIWFRIKKKVIWHKKKKKKSISNSTVDKPINFGRHKSLGTFTNWILDLNTVKITGILWYLYVDWVLCLLESAFEEEFYSNPFNMVSESEFAGNGGLGLWPICMTR